MGEARDARSSNAARSSFEERVELRIISDRFDDIASVAEPQPAVGRSRRSVARWTCASDARVGDDATQWCVRVRLAQWLREAILTRAASSSRRRLDLRDRRGRERHHLDL